MQKFSEKFMHIIFFISALISIISVALICIFLFANGIPAIHEIGFKNFIFGQNWAPSDVPASYGIFPMIIGSIYITAGSLIIGVPIGLLTAIYLATSCPDNIYKVLKPTIDLMAGIPSIVYGFFGMMVLVPFVSDVFKVNGNTILTASILLGIMILPTIINLSESALRSVPSSYYEGSLALGASKEKTIFKVIVPAAKSGIFASVILGIGRSIGETMAVIMVSGSQTRVPNSVLDGVRTMTANIVIELGYAEGLHRDALIATAVVLFVFILIINISFSIIKRRSEFWLNLCQNIKIINPTSF